MDECIEEDVTQEINEEVINEPIKPAPENTSPPENKTPLPVTRGGSGSIPSTEKIKFNDIDYVNAHAYNEALLSTLKISSALLTAILPESLKFLI